METIFGEGWRLGYIIENGKLVGMKFSGQGKYMKEAFSKLVRQEIIRSKKEMIEIV